MGVVSEAFHRPMDMESAAATPAQPSLAAVVSTLNHMWEPILRGRECTSIGDEILNCDSVGQF